MSTYSRATIIARLKLGTDTDKIIKNEVCRRAAHLREIVGQLSTNDWNELNITDNGKDLDDLYDILGRIAALALGE